LHRDAVAQALGAVGVAATGVDLGVDVARADGGNADAFGGYFLREPECEGVGGALGGRVIDVLARRADTRGRRRDVHDRAAAVSRRHAPNRFARAEEGDDDVDREDVQNAPGRHLVELRLRCHDARVVDEGMEASR